MTKEQALISLDQAKLLVQHLESNDVGAANDIVQELACRSSTELFSEVGKLTRQLHDSLTTFKLDEISSLTKSGMPDARSRLEYVIEETNKAANTTMDAVERSMPLAEHLNDRLVKVMPEWKKLMSRQLELGEFKSLCFELDRLLTEATNDSKALNSALTEVLMAQSYQDLTGQVINKVIDLVQEVEDHLVELVSTFALKDTVQEPTQQEKKESVSNIEAEGPIIDAASRDDVAQSQDDVDDLLSSLGF